LKRTKPCRGTTKLRSLSFSTCALRKEAGIWRCRENFAKYWKKVSCSAESGRAMYFSRLETAARLREPPSRDKCTCVDTGQSFLISRKTDSEEDHVVKCELQRQHTFFVPGRELLMYSTGVSEYTTGMCRRSRAASHGVTGLVKMSPAMSFRCWGVK